MNQFFLDNYQREVLTETYNVAIYCRISNEDDDKAESNSISNQKNILMRYASENGWNIIGTYVDDGYSGLSFDRPGFNRMLKDIEEGRITLVITKDMSRFGRDYILVGHYIEKFFPENNVRFIALNDNIDTMKDKGNNDIAPFKAIINDMYSKDISKKVKSVFDAKRKDGKFIGAFAAYGYDKDPNDNNKLIIDNEAAIVVKRIFSMYLSGMGQSSIAKTLNSEGIVCPSAYKREKYGTYLHGKNKIPKWCHSSIKSILLNPVYTGTMTQNKYEKVNYKSKKLKTKSKDEWIIVENTHEPIITKEEFFQAQRLMSSKRKGFTIARKKVKLFSGFAFCGDCGQYMTYFKTRAGNVYLICSSYKRYGKSQCTRHSISEDKLEQMILDDLHNIFKNFSDREMLEKEALKLLGNKAGAKDIYKQEMIAITKKIEEINTTLMSLYQDKVRGLINEDQFVDFNKSFNSEKMNLNNRYSLIQDKLDKIAEEESEIDKAKKMAEKVLNLDKLNRVMMFEIIDRIEIFEDEDIHIKYNFNYGL